MPDDAATRRILDLISTANETAWNGSSVETVDDFYTFCEARVPLIKHGVELFLNQYVLPIQIILGIAGNTLNLIVLLSTGMRSEVGNSANVLLSAMAFADISLLLCLVPASMSIYPIFYMNLKFRHFYYSTHLLRHGLANIFSTAASWLVLAVSLERYVGIRSPMHTRLQWRDWRVFVTIIFIFIAAFFISLFHFMEHDYETGSKHPCAQYFQFARLVSIFKNGTTTPLWKREYVWYAKVVQIVAVVIVAFVLIPFFNISIIRVLRNRDVLVNRTYISAATKTSEEFVRRYSDIGIRQRQERKVTATVVAIITCHVITHTPSTIPFIWETLAPYKDAFLLGFLIPNTGFQYIASHLFNCLLLTGKVLNFVLFCLSSAHFRRRLTALIRIHCTTSRQKKYSSVASNSHARNGAHVKITRMNNMSVQRQSSCTTQHSKVILDTNGQVRSTCNQKVSCAF